jgi:hypothetical protein
MRWRRKKKGTRKGAPPADPVLQELRVRLGLPPLPQAPKRCPFFLFRLPRN